MEKTELNRKYYPTIDLVKFFCAFLVVAVHTAPFSSYHQTISNGFMNYICRIAVPFYFASSGFLLFEKYKDTDFKFRNIIPYLLKILLIYVVWTLLYLRPILKSIRTNPNGIAAGILERLKLAVLSGSYIHLWYLPALIFAVALIAFLLSRKVRIKTILVPACVFYLIGAAGETYINFFERWPAVYNAFKSIESVFVTYRNGLCFGVLLVLTGVLVSKYGNRISKKTALAGLAVSAACMFIEAYAVQHFYIGVDYNFYLFLPFVVFFLLCMCAKPVEFENKYKVNVDLRNIGTLIYLIHPKLMKQFSTNSLVRYFIICLMSFLISYIIVEISKYRHFRWLKKIY